MKKKIFKFLTAAALIFGIILVPISGINEETMTTFAAVYDEVPEGYTGIYTIDDLYAIRNNLRGNYILMNDIDMSETAPGGDWDSGNGWVPINNFEGTFDGNGYAVKNMHINGEWKASRGCGLFGSLYGNVRLLAVVDCDIDINVVEDGRYDGAGRIGGIAGFARNSSNNTIIEQCYVTGSIKVKNEYERGCEVGGICGYYNKYYSYEVNAVKDSYNAASISVTVAENGANCTVGGIIGNYGRVENTYNIGNITYENKNESTNQNPWYEIGNIVGYHAGAVPKTSYFLKTANNYDEYGDLNGTKSAVGSSLTTGQMKSRSAFTGFDFNSVWTIGPDAEYSYPTLINVPHISEQSSIVEPTEPSVTIIQGDANDDGFVNIRDAAYIARRVAQRKTNLLPEWADYNNDGRCDIRDAAAIARDVARRILR